MKTTVGELRAQSAYCSQETPVVISVASDDPDRDSLRSLLDKIQVKRFYPDGAGHGTSVFKIEVSLVPLPKLQE